MATVDQDLQAIKSAIYGEEVRGAIVDAIENCYDLHSGIVEAAIAATEKANNAGNEFRDVLRTRNSVEFLSSLTKKDATTNGIIFHIESDGSCTVNGTSTAVAQFFYFNNKNSLPEWVIPGEKYYLSYESPSLKVEFSVIQFDSAEAIISQLYYTSDGEIEIDADAVGMALKLYVRGNRTIANENVNPKICNAPSNLELYKTISENPWKGLTWYSYGTSFSDMNMDGKTGNNPRTGSYPWVLEVDKYAQMNRVNKAIGSGGIVPYLSHGGNVKENILACPWDVDLVTLELGYNDWRLVPLGELGDKSDNTFIGNFTQCLEYLINNTRAKIVLITEPSQAYDDSTQETRRDKFATNKYGTTLREVIDLEIEVCHRYSVEVIDLGAMMNASWLNKQTLLDHLHPSEKGGVIMGRLVWSKLKNIIPCPYQFTKEDL